MILPVMLLLFGLVDGPVEVTVGMTGRLDGISLPGTELEAKPYSDRKTPVFLRIRSVKQVGTEFKYDLEFQGFDPGRYDLRKYLQRKDGSPVDNLPALTIQVNSLRPPGQVEPHVLEMDSSFWLGGYRWWLLLGGLLWLFVLVMIIYYGFWPKRKAAIQQAAAPKTLADKLRPLVESALAGTAKTSELATLERCLLTWWRRKLLLDGQSPHRSAETLREHAEAGPLLQQLELWLHRPGAREQVDVAKLLSPYRTVEADALDRLGATT
jgi:cbb3-type cytochrome oxidase subunit 3